MGGIFLIFCMKFQQHESRKLGKIILTKRLFWTQTEPKMKHFSFVENWKMLVHFFFHEIAAAWRLKIALNNCCCFCCCCCCCCCYLFVFLFLQGVGRSCFQVFRLKVLICELNVLFLAVNLLSYQKNPSN